MLTLALTACGAVVTDAFVTKEAFLGTPSPAYLAFYLLLGHLYHIFLRGIVFVLCFSSSKLSEIKYFGH